MKKTMITVVALATISSSAFARWETAVVKEVQFFSSGAVKALITRDRGGLNLTRTVPTGSGLAKEMTASLLTARSADLKIKYEQDGIYFKNLIVGTAETIN